MKCSLLIVSRGIEFVCLVCVVCLVIAHKSLDQNFHTCQLSPFIMPKKKSTSARQSFLSNNGSLSPIKTKVPTTKAEWSKVPNVEDGRASFSSASEHAKFITQQVKNGAIPLSAVPNKIRDLYPFLHQYKKKSFQQWFYKLRREIKSVDLLDEGRDGSLASTASTDDSFIVDNKVPIPAVVAASSATSTRKTPPK